MLAEFCTSKKQTRESPREIPVFFECFSDLPRICCNGQTSTTMILTDKCSLPILWSQKQHTFDIFCGELKLNDS